MKNKKTQQALKPENLKVGVVLAAVNEIENLTTGLSRKIWQKLMILEKLHNELKQSSDKSHKIA